MPPRRLGACVPALRGDLDTILAKALEKDKTRRYDSAAELAADIRRHLHHEPITARPASAVYHMRKFARRQPVLVTSMVLVLSILLGSAWIVALNWAWRDTEVAQAQARSDQLGSLVSFRLARQLAQRGAWTEALVAYDEALERNYADEIEIAIGKIEAYLGLSEKQRVLDELRALAGRDDLGSHKAKVLLLQGMNDVNRSQSPSDGLDKIEEALDEGTLSPADEAFGAAYLSQDLRVVRALCETALKHDRAHHGAAIMLGTVLFWRSASSRLRCAAGRERTDFAP